MEQITSAHNQHIKHAVMLRTKHSARRHHRLFIIEGRRELMLASKAGYCLQSIFVCSSIYDGKPLPKCDAVYDITPALFAKLACRASSDGIIAIAHQKQHLLADIKLSANPFIILIEGIEKPGNIGAILRTADAAAVDAVIVCNPLCDIYNSNCIRASIGAVFCVQTACCSAADALSFLMRNNIRIYAAALGGSVRYDLADMRSPCAIALGTEDAGLSSWWLEHSHQRIMIPMRGCMDSLNVSVSAAAITFEAIRQRSEPIQ
jgi:TrmH family RNA methyltransferase